MSAPSAPPAAPATITPQVQSHFQELLVGTRNATQTLDALRAQLSAISTARARERGSTPQRGSTPDASLSPTPQPQSDDSPLKLLVDEVEHGIGEAEVRTALYVHCAPLAEALPKQVEWNGNATRRDAEIPFCPVSNAMRCEQ